MKRFLVCVATGLFWWLGCGVAPEELQVPEPPGPTELAEQAVGEACSPQSLAWSVGATSAEKICAGPWEYALPCYRLRTNDSRCELASRTADTCYPTCVHPDFGLSTRVSRSFSYTISPDAHREYICDEIRKPPCQWETTYDYDEPCRRAAVAEYNRIDSRYRSGVTYTYSYVQPKYQGNSTTCNVLFQNYPVYKSGTGPQCGPGTECNVVETYYACRPQTADNLEAPVNGVTSCGPSPRYTAPGLSEAQVAAEANTLWEQSKLRVKPAYQLSTLTFTRPPRCTTCEDGLLTSSDTDVRAKYACLDTNLNAVASLPSGSAPSGVDRSALRDQLVSNLKLLYELEGSRLQETQQQRVRDLYVSQPAAERSCGAAFIPPPVASSCGDLSTLNGQLDLCARMTASHVMPTFTYQHVNMCLDLAPAVAALDPVLCKGTEYRAAYQNIWLALLERGSLNLPRDTHHIPLRPELQSRLGAISRWFSLARTHFYPGQPVPEDLWRDMNQTFSTFWKSVYAGGLLTQDSSGVTPGVDPLNIGMRTDQAILEAALMVPQGSSLPLQGPPLLTLLGDSLRGVHDRIDDFSALHDLGCRFKDCKSGQVRTEVTELWQILGSLADPAALNTAVDNASNLRVALGQRQAWWPIFDALRRHHTTLQSAVNDVFGDTTYDPGSLALTSPTLVPEPAVPLARIIQDGRNRFTYYQTSGTLLPTARNSLRLGIQETKRQQLDNEIAARKQALDNAISDYQANRQAYLNARVAELNNVQDIDTLASEVEQKLKRFYDLASDHKVLRRRAAQEEATFGNFARSFNTALAAEQADLARLAIDRDEPHVLNISAAEAHFVPGDLNHRYLPNFAVQQGGQAWKLQADAGDIINLNTTGRWAPACVLSQAQLHKPLGGASEMLGITVSNPLTGPEGYEVKYENGAFNAHKNSTQDRFEVNNAREICAGWSQEFGTGFHFIVEWEAKFFFEAKACLELDGGREIASENENGNESRLTAEYSTGLRLPGTPFPHLPAGSLLLVEMERNGTLASHIRDIRVVQDPDMSVVIGSKPGLPAGTVDPGVDVYLVVNDASLANCEPETSEALTVKVQQLSPAGTVARQVGKTMAHVLTDLRATTEEIIPQGRVLPQELVALRDAARAQLALECDCNLEQFPASLMALYEAFVSKELARLERQVEIRSVERAMDALTLELKGISDDLDSSTKLGRLLRLVPAWSLRNLDGERLRESSRSLFTLVNDNLYPVVDLRYPSALGTLRTEAALDNLIRADWTQSYVDLAGLAKTAVDRIQARLNEARLQDPNPSYVQVALSFPRPGRTVTSPWRKVSGERAAAVWSSLLSQDTTQPLRFTLQLTPEDLYTAFGGTAAQLQCTEGTPILHRLAAFWSRPATATPSNASLNSQRLRSTTVFQPSLAFTGETGLKTYQMENPLWLRGPTRMLFGVPDDALTTFQSQELSLAESEQTPTGDGLSPFVTVDLDVTGFRNLSVNPLNDADELVVLMQVDRRTVASLHEPALCQ